MWAKYYQNRQFSASNFTNYRDYNILGLEKEGVFTSHFESNWYLEWGYQRRKTNKLKIRNWCPGWVEEYLKIPLPYLLGGLVWKGEKGRGEGIDKLKLTATAAIGVVILLMISKPSLERRSFVWPGSGSTIGNLYVYLSKRKEKEKRPASDRVLSLWPIDNV